MIRTHIIRGEPWNIKFGKTGKKYVGLCGENKIRIKAGLTGAFRLDVLLHELMHACYPDVKEEVIDESATDIANVLWELGYRDINNGEGE